MVRDATNRDGETLTFTPDAWHAFLSRLEE